MAIHFQNLEGHDFRLGKKTAIREWLLLVIRKEGKHCGEINYLFASDAYVLEQNKKYLRHNTYTDIITFHSNEGKILNADILISTDRVRDNAEKLGTAPDEELRRVMVHGVLHLCGYKDKSERERKQMRDKEEICLKLFSKAQTTARR